MIALDLVEIVNLDDDLLLPWFDLYETAFPAGERLLISTQLTILKNRAKGKLQNQRLYASQDERGKFLGLIEFENFQEEQTAYLWYMAVQPDLRGNGIGSQMYQHLLKRLVPPGTKALVFEVEIPEDADSEEHKRLSERRIAFYRKQGAYLIEGIHYMQYIGWHHPPTPMHLMVHPLRPLEPQQTFDLAKAIFGDALRQLGPLALI